MVVADPSAAANVVFDSGITVWQVASNVYTQVSGDSPFADRAFPTTYDNSRGH